MEHKEITRKPFRGELALAVAVVINSFSVVLMLYSGAGISTISGVPYAFSEVLTFFSLGTCTYLFQAALVLTLMILRRRFVLPYLLSFAAGAMLYVVVEELIPEMSQGRHSNIGTICFALGFGLMMVLDVALG